jgi:hypothetical protein
MLARCAAQCCGSAQNLYTLVLAKVEKVGISGDDPFRLSFDPAFQDTIVIRILLDDIDALSWMDELSAGIKGRAVASWPPKDDPPATAAPTDSGAARSSAWESLTPRIEHRGPRRSRRRSYPCHRPR